MRRLCSRAQALLFCALLSGSVWALNPIQLENTKSGTGIWQLENPANDHEIEGYASLTSVARGGSINFHISSADPVLALAIYRVGWYGGAGGRQIADAI